MPSAPLRPGFSRSLALFAGARVVSPLLTGVAASVGLVLLPLLLPATVDGPDPSRVLLVAMLFGGGMIGGLLLYVAARGLEEAATDLDVGAPAERMAAPLVAVAVLALRPLLTLSSGYFHGALVGLFTGLVALLPPVFLLARLGRVLGALGDSVSRAVAYGFAAVLAVPYCARLALALASGLEEDTPTAFSDPRVWIAVGIEGLGTATEVALVGWLIYVAVTRR